MSVASVGRADAGDRLQQPAELAVIAPRSTPRSIAPDGEDGCFIPPRFDRRRRLRLLAQRAAEDLPDVGLW